MSSSRWAVATGRIRSTTSSWSRSMAGSWRAPASSASYAMATPTYDIWGAVDPAYRRRGLGTALLGWTMDHARVRASREDPRTPVHLRGFSEDTETGHRALLVAAGFETVRHFFLMLKAGLDDVPDAPLPEGLEIRAVAEDQWRTIFDAENEAFRDHWGHREMTDNDFRGTYRPRSSTPTCGSSPGTATASPASSRPGSGRGERATGGRAVAGSTTSACDVHGAGADSPGR